MKELSSPKDLKVSSNCRVCGKGNLKPVLSLGVQYIVNFVESESRESLAAPLELVICDKLSGGCGLVQLRHTVSPELLYRKFWYKSGINQTMINQLATIAAAAERIVAIKPNDIIVDIGANDGTLLRCYSTKDARLVGFEPAVNLIEEARVGTTLIINDFFNYDSFKERFGTQKAKVITSIAMFYDLDEPNRFVEDIVNILDQNGVWIIQMNYLVTMLQNNAFDNISHEHLEYYSLQSLKHLLDRHGLVVFDLEFNEINGGSIRTYVKRKDCSKYPVTDRVKDTLETERKMRIDDHQIYLEFASKLQELKNKTYNFIKDVVNQGKTVYVYGASTRGHVLLQFYNLDHKLITAAADRNPVKWGKKIVGTSIPIMSEEEARSKKPDYFLVLPWYFIDEFKKREDAFLRAGGKFIVPLPQFRLIGLE